MMRLVYRVPDVVGKLLEPPEETSLYAFLLRDDLDWKLIGSFNSKCYTPPSYKPAEESSKSAFPAPSTSGVNNKGPMVLKENPLSEES